MKTKILTLAFLLGVAAAYAQQLTNAGFETWTSNVPTPWGTLDQALTADGLTGSTYVTKSSSPHSGSFAATVQTQAAPLVGTVVTGALIYGTISVNVSTQKATFKGLPYTYNPSSATYYLKGTLNAADTAGTYVLLSKWNTVSGKRDTLGQGFDTITSITSTYALRTVNINYTKAGTPDSIQYLIVSSAKKKPAVGTAITVDDITMNFSTSVESYPFAPTQVSAYPNPAQSQVCIGTSNAKAKYLTIFDLCGRVVANEEFTNPQIFLDVRNFQNGLYIYRITDANSQVLQCAKFAVSK